MAIARQVAGGPGGVLAAPEAALVVWRGDPWLPCHGDRVMVIVVTGCYHCYRDRRWRLIEGHARPAR